MDDDGFISATTMHDRRLLIRASEVAFAAELPAGDGRFDGNGVWQVQPARVSIVLRSGERGECVMRWDDFVTALVAAEGAQAGAQRKDPGRTSREPGAEMGHVQ